MAIAILFIIYYIISGLMMMIWVKNTPFDKTKKTIIHYSLCFIFGFILLPLRILTVITSLLL